MPIIGRAIGDLTILGLKGRLVVRDGGEVFRETINRLAQLGRRT